MIDAGKKVRIVMQRAFPDEPPTIFRGDVKTCDDRVVMIQGRRFAKILEPTTNRAEEKPLDSVEKDYLIPMAAVRFLEMIQSGSKEEELDAKIRAEPMIRRKGGFALID